MINIIFFIGIIISILIRVFFILHGLDVADVLKAHQVATVMLQGNNPYPVIDFAIYPPLNYFIETLTLLVSNSIAIPFHILTKAWPNIADLAITFFLFKFLINQKIRPLYAYLWSLMYFLNPISILISSAHGQIDSVTSLLLLLSIYVLTLKTSKYYLFGSLLLGLAIAIKPNPTMLLPVFLVYKFNQNELKQKLIFTLVSLAPVTITLIPYLWINFHAVITNIFSYSGVYDFGYAAIFRGLWYQNNADIWLPLTQEILSASKYLFLSGLLFLAMLFINSKQLIKACLTVYLFFLSVYFGISAQYLIWILPLAILEKDLKIIPFTFSGLIAIFGFYMFFGPEILLGNLSTLSAFQSKYMSVYFLGNLTLWLTMLWWLITIIKNYLKVNYSTFSITRKRLIKITAVILLLSFLPVLRVIMLLISQIVQ